MRSWMWLLLVVVLVGCDRSHAPVGAPDHSYTSRGLVERMQLRNDDRILVLHEAIPDFIGIDGEPAPMAPMAMPFAIAEGVSLKGVKVGTKLAFSFDVRWKDGEPLTITELTVLPTDAKVVFSD